MRHGLYEQNLFIAYKSYMPNRDPLSSTTEAGRKDLKETSPSGFYATKSYSQSMIRELFETADKDRLLAAGDPLPGDEPFTIYRGTSYSVNSWSCALAYQLAVTQRNREG
jgi:hypothetical protein